MLARFVLFGIALLATGVSNNAFGDFSRCIATTNGCFRCAGIHDYKTNSSGDEECTYAYNGAFCYGQNSPSTQATGTHMIGTNGIETNKDYKCLEGGWISCDETTTTDWQTVKAYNPTTHDTEYEIRFTYNGCNETESREVRCRNGYKTENRTVSGVTYSTNDLSSDGTWFDDNASNWVASSGYMHYTCTSCGTAWSSYDFTSNPSNSVDVEYYQGTNTRYKRTRCAGSYSYNAGLTGNMRCVAGYYGTPSYNESSNVYTGCTICPSAWQLVQKNTTTGALVREDCLVNGSSYSETDERGVFSATGSDSITDCYVASTAATQTWYANHGTMTTYDTEYKDDTGTFVTSGRCYYSTTGTNKYSTICPAS